MSEKKYSYVDLEELIISAQKFLNQGEYDKKLVFLIRSNIKEAKNALELIHEDVKQEDEYLQKELSENEYKRFSEFEEKRSKLFTTNNYKISERGDNWDQLDQENRDEITDGIAELQLEYGESIEAAKSALQEVMEYNEKVKTEKVAEIDFKEIPLDLFPDSLTGSQLPDPFMEFVVMGE